MDNVICEKCKKTMQKKGTLMMSNSKFQVYVCPGCGANKKVCIGVMN